MAAVTDWWQGLTARERLLIAMMVATMLAVAIYFGVYRPLTGYHAQAVRAYAAAQDMAQEVAIGLARADQLEQQAERRPAVRESVRVAAGQTARALGLTISRLQPGQDGRVTLWLDEVAAPLLFQWLAELETAHGVVVARASVTPGRGQSTVNAQIELMGVGA
ncbi:MAG: type II secretion system protein GspM [Rhodothalassiaceae bacterium]